MPLSHREKLRTLLPFTPVNHTTTTLAYATRDPSGILVTTHPVQNRPWEWMEYLGEPPGGQAEADRPQDEHTHPPGRRAIRNAGAISLDLFDAQMTGDGVPDTSLDARARAALHTFEDGLAGDSLFQRAWRESRLEPPDVPVTAARTRNEDMDTLSALPNFPRAPGSRPTSRGPSPTSSVFSRAPSWQYGALGYAMPSAPPSGAGSLRGSPAGPFAHATASRASVSTSASGEGEVGELPQVAVQNARRASKRKAHAPIEDDDVQIIDPPAGAKKSTKGRTAAKTKGKR